MKFLAAISLFFISSLSLFSGVDASSYVKCNADCITFPDAGFDASSHDVIFEYVGPVTSFDASKFIFRTFITQLNSQHLTLTLKSPQNTMITMASGKGSGRSNIYYGSIWYDGAAIDIATVSITRNGGLSPLNPEEPFSTFNGEDPRGNWTFTVTDTIAGSGTTLNRAIWTILGDAPCSSTTKECTYAPAGGFATDAFTIRVRPSELGTYRTSTDFNMFTRIQHTIPGYEMQLVAESKGFRKYAFNGYDYYPTRELVPSNTAPDFYNNVLFTNDAEFRDFEYTTDNSPSELKFWVPHDPRKANWVDGEFYIYYRSNGEVTLNEITLRFYNVDDACQSNPCQNGGVCTASGTTAGSGYTCDCTGTGFAGTDCGSCLTMRRSIKNVNPSNNFPVVLNKAPAEDVYVRVDSDCASFESCTLIFTPTNWFRQQNIIAYQDVPNPYTVHSDRGVAVNCPINAYIVSNDECNGDGADTLAVLLDPKGEVATEATASSVGDPHIHTFDGRMHHFFDIGDFYFVREMGGIFVVQTRQERCGRSASCNTAAVFKTGNVVVYFTTSPSPQVSIVGDALAGGVSVSGSGDSYTLTDSNGIKVEVLFVDFGTYIIDIYVTVGSSFITRVVGLAGFYSGVPYDDYIKPDGTAATTQNEFQQSWRVPTADNLFLDPSVTFSNITDNFDVNPNSNSLNKQCSYTPSDKDTGDLQNPDPPSLPPPPPNDPDYQPPDCYDNATLVAEAEALCDAVFGDSVAQCCINAGVNVTLFSESCVCDYVLSGSTDFITSNVEAFYTACEEATTAQSLPSCQPCPGACNGNGACNAGVCSCDSPFQGDDCSEDWNQPPEITSSQLNSGISCTKTLTVLGKYFYGTGLICRFNGNEDIPATKINNFQLLCALPAYDAVVGGAPLTVQVVRSDSMVSNVHNFNALTSCCADPCLNGGSCTDDATDGFQCSCPGDFTGDTCENDPCTPNPCQNGGSCSVSGTTFTCDCSSTGGFSGTTCDIAPTTQPPTTQPPTTQPPTTQPPTTQPPTTQPPTTQPPTTQPPTTQPPTTQPPTTQPPTTQPPTTPAPTTACPGPFVDVSHVTSTKAGSDCNSEIFITFIGSLGESGPHSIGRGFSLGSTNTQTNINLCGDIGVFHAIVLTNSGDGGDVLWRVDTLDVTGALTGHFGKHMRVKAGNPRTLELPFHVTFLTKNNTESYCPNGAYITLVDHRGVSSSFALAPSMERGVFGEFHRPYINLFEFKKMNLGSFIGDTWDFEFITVERRQVVYTWINTLGFPFNNDYHLWQFFHVSAVGPNGPV